jgi:hypothetical protein
MPLDFLSKINIDEIMTFLPLISFLLLGLNSFIIFIHYLYRLITNQDSFNFRRFSILLLVNVIFLYLIINFIQTFTGIGFHNGIPTQK